jgi:hypothetical protein
MMEEACCACAALLSTILPQYDEKTEKPKALDRRLECCGRVICGNCIGVCQHAFSHYRYILTDDSEKLAICYILSLLPGHQHPFSITTRPPRSACVHSSVLEFLSSLQRTPTFFLGRPPQLFFTYSSTNPASGKIKPSARRRCPPFPRP